MVKNARMIFKGQWIGGFKGPNVGQYIIYKILNLNSHSIWRLRPSFVTQVDDQGTASWCRCFCLYYIRGCLASNRNVISSKVELKNLHSKQIRSSWSYWLKSWGGWLECQAKVWGFAIGSFKETDLVSIPIQLDISEPDKQQLHNMSYPLLSDTFGLRHWHNSANS